MTPQQEAAMRQALELAVDALRVARDSVSEWSSYASDYFTEKYDLDGDLSAIDDSIEAIEAVLTAALEQPAQDEPINKAFGEFIYAPTSEKAAAYARMVEKTVNLVQPAQQEPVAWGVDWGKAGDIPCVSIIKRLPDGGIEVLAVEYAPYQYTRPQAREWVGLTDEDIGRCFDDADGSMGSLIAAIEAKLREKNA